MSVHQVQRISDRSLMPAGWGLKRVPSDEVFLRYGCLSGYLQLGLIQAGGKIVMRGLFQGEVLGDEVNRGWSGQQKSLPAIPNTWWINWWASRLKLQEKNGSQQISWFDVSRCITFEYGDLTSCRSLVKSILTSGGEQTRSLFADSSSKAGIRHYSGPNQPLGWSNHLAAGILVIYWRRYLHNHPMLR